MLKIKLEIYHALHRFLGHVIDWVVTAELYFYDKFLSTIDEMGKR
ncbi:hypothetical protein [Turicimonas muris]|nr:hypothetical protein [Turicimonas muris]